jgi:hypothetical protein
VINKTALAGARHATEQALAAARNGRDELIKLQSGSLTANQSGTSALTKMADQLDAIRAGIIVLEAYEHAQHQYGRTQ